MRNAKERVQRALVVKACRAMSAQGLVAATDGNVSVRLDSKTFLVTPSGVSKGEVTARSLLRCDSKGQGIGLPAGAKISSEVKMHLAVYAQRPDVMAVVHAHPPTACAFTLAGMERIFREPVLSEVAALLGPVPCAPYRTPGTAALAQAAARACRNADAVLLARHGAITLGPDPWQAFLRMEKLEHAARTFRDAIAFAGSPRRIKRLTARELVAVLERHGTPEVKARWRGRLP